jgi:hypothetical protein
MYFYQHPVNDNILGIFYDNGNFPVIVISIKTTHVSVAFSANMWLYVKAPVILLVQSRHIWTGMPRHNECVWYRRQL